MKIVDFKSIQRVDAEPRFQKSNNQKNHAELLKEAFLALEKYKVPQMYKNH